MCGYDDIPQCIQMKEGEELAERVVEGLVSV